MKWHSVGTSVMMCFLHNCAQFCYVLWHCELMFYLEWSSLMSSRQRSGMSRPLLTICVHVLTYQYLLVRVHLWTLLWENLSSLLCKGTQARSEKQICNEDKGIKVRRATALQSEGGEKRQKGWKTRRVLCRKGWENEGKMEGWCRFLQTAWGLLTPSLQDWR